MRLSLELIYYGDCKEMIAFYAGIFDQAETEIRTYAEMPGAEALGIQELGLGMVWRGALEIRYGSHAVRFQLSDSLIIASGEDVGYKGQANHPLICIEHPDEEYVRRLFGELYGGQHSFEEIQKGIHGDRYGLRWIYKKSHRCSICHCLEFKGNCGEVAAYVRDAWQVNMAELVKYADSPYAGEVDVEAKDKIYGAWMEFSDKHCTYAIKYADSLESVLRNYNGYGSEEKLWYQIILVVEDSDEKHLTEAFEKLSAGAVLNRPISPNGEGRLYGSLIDRYGFVWEVFGCRSVSFPAPPGETPGSAPVSL